MSDEQGPPSRRGAIVAMAVIVVGIVLVIFMVERLHQSSAIQDCVMSGRSNCAPIETPRQ